VISTELLELASIDDHGILLEYEAQGSGDVNPRFQDLAIGTTYCVESTGYLNPQPAYHYVELTTADTLTIERLDQPCNAVAEADRGFSVAAIEFVR
jgi:hypothetical protein